MKEKEEELSQEEFDLKERLDLYVQNLQNDSLDPVTRLNTITSLRIEVQTSTSSIKFLRPHYGTIVTCYNAILDSCQKEYLADILSVLAMTMSAEGQRDSLKYSMLGSKGDIDYWGHEYVRNLAGEISEEYAQRQQTNEAELQDLMEIAEKVICFYMKHNAEHEAADLSMKVEDLSLLMKNVDVTNYKKTSLYLTSVSSYLTEPDKRQVLERVYNIYLMFNEYPSALRIALSLANLQYLKDLFAKCEDHLQKKQLCYMLAWHGTKFVLDETMVANEKEREVMQELINNAKLSEAYLDLARDIQVMEPKSPEEVYKTQPIDGMAGGASVDSATQNLAATFVNAFVNAGFGQDKLMTILSESSGVGRTGSWVFKNKGFGKTSAAASLGMIFLWDVHSGLAQIGKYHKSENKFEVAGALLGIGICNSYVSNDSGHAFALLANRIGNDNEEEEEENHEDVDLCIGAIMGLGLAFAGSQNEEVRKKLAPFLEYSDISDVIAFAAVSLGLVYVGSCNEYVAQSIYHGLISMSWDGLPEPLTRFAILGLGLVYLGKQEDEEVMFEGLDGLFDEKMRKYIDVVLLSCTYAGTGDVLKVQNLLALCEEHLEKDAATHQKPAVLGIAMVAMTEETGLEMAIRSLENLLKYGEQNIREAVPLALGLLCISNPKVNVIDTLSRLSRDSVQDVSMAAIISLGLVGSGTNNADIANMLRNLSNYYSEDHRRLFCVRIAQGLVHLGKGLLTLTPYHSERFLLSPTVLAGIITFLHVCLDLKSSIIEAYPHVLYFLVLAMKPKMLMTVDEDLKPLAVSVRVGQALDVAGKPGIPKSITGFRTQVTPVLLAAGEKAELENEKYIPLTPFLEGFVILRRNPDYSESQ